MATAAAVSGLSRTSAACLFSYASSVNFSSKQPLRLLNREISVCYFSRGKFQDSPGFFKVRASSGGNQTRDEGKELWKKELAGVLDESTDSWDSDAMQNDIDRLSRKRRLEKMKTASYRESLGEREAEGWSLKAALDKLLVADFFFILLVLSWFLAGILQRTTVQDSSLLDAWLPLWTPLFQPALGIFMAGALVSAVSGFLKDMENKE